MMTSRQKWIFLAVGAGSFAPILHISAEPKGLAFPTGYREWVHVKSAVLGPQFPAFETEGGIHHIYANDKARQGFKTGNFPDGSIVVYDLLTTTENNGVMSEGARRRVDVMYKDSQAYRESGGWRFERFMGDDQSTDVLSPEHRASCFQCHKSQEKHDFVFSQFRR